MKHLLLLPLSLVLLLTACSTTTQSPSLSTQSEGSCVVINTNDSGDGSLRAAIADSSCSIITFDSSLSGQTISLTSVGLLIDKNLTITGPAAGVTINGENQHRVLYVNIGRTVTLENLTITGGDSNNTDGGGIWNSSTLIIRNSTITDNKAQHASGGGIYNGGTLTLENSTVSGNSAGSTGGGIRNNDTLIIRNSTVSGNSAGFTGGGILNDGTLTIESSTIHTNFAGGNGGGIFNNFGGELTITNSTFFGNQATSGGALFTAYDDSQITRIILINNTIVANHSRSSTSGAVFNQARLKLVNTILAFNTGGAGNYTQAFPGQITVDLSNINGGDDIGLEFDNGTPKLANNGGPTMTVALLPIENSRAIDKGVCSYKIGDTTYTIEKDQRGYLRPAGAACDIGAYEFDAVPMPDTTKPTVTLTTPFDGATYLLGQAVLADFACHDEPGGSGIASCGGTVENGAAIDTATVGLKTFTVTAKDHAGNTYSVQVSYTVVYAFSGFSAPVNHGAVNVAKAGQTIPLKWRVTDASGNPITTLTNVTVTAAVISCSTGNSEEDPVEQYTTGNSGLQNLGNGNYQFNWKTTANFSNSCRIMHLNLGDGITRQVQFRFTR